VRQKAVPLVGEMTPRNEKLYRNTRLPVLTVFTNIDTDRKANTYKYITTRVRNIARLWKGKVNFNLANISDFRRDMDQKYDMSEAYGKKNILVGLRHKAVYYEMPGDFSEKKLSQFVTDFFEEKLEGSQQVCYNEGTLIENVGCNVELFFSLYILYFILLFSVIFIV
jgi:hypothetical protein